MTLENTPSRSILIVEDERIIALDIQRALKGLGYRVTGTASSCAQALEAAARDRPDLALMDVRIEGPVDGIETAARLNERYGIPVVYVTAHADVPTVDRAKGGDVYGYVVKPFADLELRAAIEIALCKHTMETELRRRERWYSTTLRSMGDAVITVDPEARITFLNAAAEALTGWTAADVIGRPVDEILTFLDGMPDVVLEHPLRLALAEGRVVHTPPSAAVRDRNGEVKLIEDSAAPIDDNGERLGAVMVATDVTERRELERQVAMADRLASLGMVAAGVAHEINNPLSYVMADIELIRRRLGRLESGAESTLAEIRRLLDEVQEGSERIRDIVADLRSFSAFTGNGKGPIDPHGPLGWALRVTGPQMSGVARLVTDLAPVPPVLADDGRLGQVFLNILVNAVQAIDPGNPAANEIHVTTGVTDSGEVSIRVTDTGRGMQPDVVRRIFQPFFTTKQHGVGTGLGLAVTHGIVKSLGGRIDVETEPGAGTAFTLTLPAAAGPPQPPRSAPAPARDRPRRSATILVVEDQPQVGAALARLLEEGHQVTVKTRAREALRVLETGKRFDVVLCDMLMPDMDGETFYRAVLALVPDQAAQFLFMTAALESPAVERFLAGVPNPRIPKPVVPDRVLDEIDALVGAAAPTRG